MRRKELIRGLLGVPAVASVWREDAGLLMYYDNALMRAEAEPMQGRLL